MAQHILDVNAMVAKRIGINPCARATCVKPAGTTSSILGTSSGIHPHHAKRYFRRAQANEDELLVDFFKGQNPKAVEKSVWNPNGTDVVLTFCVTASPDALTKRDVNAVDLLNKVKLTKENWIDAGKRTELCAQPWLSHNVSNTISVKDDEWDHVESFIYDNRHAFAGISLLPEGGDLDYPQAPFCEVLSADEIVDYYGVGALLASGLIVDGMHAFDDNLWAACDNVLGRGENLDTPTAKVYPKRVYEAMEEIRTAKMDWIRRAHKFASNYFGGDRIKLTRCLKRVSACKHWEDLTRSYAPVDYTQLIERQDNTTVTQTVACAGGKCEII
jgi:ribonucleoside-diphosphate reductase alpha chain